MGTPDTTASYVLYSKTFETPTWTYVGCTKDKQFMVEKKPFSHIVYGVRTVILGDTSAMFSITSQRGGY